MRKILFIIYVLTCLLPGIVSAQSITVKGVVIDGGGQPLPGATIKVKGTKKATVAKQDGNFTISAEPQNILVFSFSGFITKEITLTTQTTLRIQLQEDKNDLNEVVVVAFGQQKKPTVTGAISTVSGKDLRQSPVANLTNALAGRLSGLFAQQNSGQPGKDQANIQIRGISTYRSGTSPLFIVDGIQQDDIGQIDMNEVENISILKDASATAVYGVRGANGVIIVTTRRGKTGEAKVSVSSQTGVNVTHRLPKFLDAYNSLLLLKESYVNDGQAASFPYSDAEMEHFRTGDMPSVYPNVDWSKEVMRKSSLQTQFNANVQGGTERVKYFVSAGYLNQNGIFKNFSQSETDNTYYFKRYNFRSNLDINVNKNLDLSLNLATRLENVNQPHPAESGRSVFNQLMRVGFAPYNFPIYNPDGSFGAPKESNQHANLLAQLTLAGYDRSYKTDITSTVNATHKLDFVLKGLSAKAQMAFSNAQFSSKSLYRDGYPTYRYNPVNDTYLLFNSNYPVLRPYQTSTGNLAPKSVTDLQASLNYDNVFGKHTISLLALYNQNSTKEGSNRDINYLGYVGRLTYNYNQRYMLEINSGYNGSNQFNDQNHFGFFPAVSAGWVISEESFLKKNLSFINFMKLRGSYGMVGNDKIGIDLATYAYLSTYVSTGSYGFGDNHTSYSGLAEGKIGNPDLTWEKERKANIGIEADFFQSKFKVTFDYFDNQRYDIITTRATVGQIVGVTLPEMNIGKVRNRGYELEIAHNSKLGNVEYFLKGNISVARNKILERDEEKKKYPWLQSTGLSVGQLFGYKAIGFYNDANDLANSPKNVTLNPQVGDLKFADLNNDGIINDDDKGPIGYPNVPNTSLGLSGGIGYKGFDFSFLLQGALNGSVRLSDELIYDNAANRFQETHLGRWTPETATTATYPKLHLGSANNRSVSSFWLRSNDYLRLKNVEIGYRFTPKAIQRIGIESLRVYANGANLLTWDYVKLIDPESPSGRGENYPQQRIFSFGLNLNF